ncbi:TPA: hypothetical protein GRI54_21270 [Vibrio parahaemolyticus]|uniref:hypothetical protein n=2 Tax=Vibrio parahaemolyticus TaxID=670 RepID=UPI0004227C08|nr:hypothetical protein [Vibrio parahaemolyticus]EGS6500258.1 hypothetical protein [Vibrio parahaemolyticus]EII2984447.1 hypothetical protein [Vibrio parahaemolyticus]EJE1250845.1 hypothetical protein [Vibrio parahaemolyticus]EJG0709750.1 hypothetical protein [Vibrio parahaemolyticus]ELF4878603.1 hypothetical protein [Vibrio parahaemolyticus]
MSHIYINAEPEGVVLDVLIKNKTHFKRTVLPKLKLDLFYDKSDWPEEPMLISEKSELYISGWFIFNDKKNDLYGFKKFLDENINYCLENKDFTSLTQYIDTGVFIAVYINNGNVYIISDPFALSNHYYSLNDNVKIAPYPSVLGESIDSDLNDFLHQQGHLFGKYTAYKDVFRFLPNDLILFDSKNFEIYTSNYDIEPVDLKNENVYLEIKKTISHWNDEEISLALSAGFDSRLIASVCSPYYTYTWGPSSSLDQKIAKKIALLKSSHHLSFLFKSIPIKNEDKCFCEAVFSGVVKDYNSQFFANYKYVNSLTKQSHVALDGYLGDVLQRGVYLYPVGIKGEFVKIFPSMLTKTSSPKEILRTRYKKVDDNLFSLLYEDFLSKTENLNSIDDYNKVTYYEFVYGRGLRYITTGAVVMNSIFKTVVPCFANKKIFSALINNHASRVANYTVFSEVWSDIKEPYKSYISEGFYSPSTNRIMIPIFNFFGRLITNKVRHFQNYTKE